MVFEGTLELSEVACRFGKTIKPTGTFRGLHLGQDPRTRIRLAFAFSVGVKHLRLLRLTFWFLESRHSVSPTSDTGTGHPSPLNETSDDISVRGSLPETELEAVNTLDEVDVAVRVVLGLSRVSLCVCGPSIGCAASFICHLYFL